MPENFNLNSDSSSQNFTPASGQNSRESSQPVSEPTFGASQQPSPGPTTGQYSQQAYESSAGKVSSSQQSSGQLAKQPFGQASPEQSFQQSPEQSFQQPPEHPPKQEQAPEQQFAPPPSNVFIRTSESDLERIKSEGGSIPGIEPAFTDPSISPETADTSFEEFSVDSESSAGKNNKLIPLLIIGILIIGAGLLGYFYLMPLLFNKEEAVVTTTTTLETTTTTLAVSSPYPQISGPFQKSVFNVDISGEVIKEAIKSAAISELASPDTFKILISQVHNDSLTNEEVVLSLVPQLPIRLHPYLLARKYLVYTYYGEVNPALGLIIDIGEENKEEVKSVFLAWEKNLGILNDLKEFFLVSIPKQEAKEFQETTNAGAEIRYFAYDGEEAAISYAFSEQYLIMSSSLESINSAISHLRGVTEPIHP